MNAIRANGATNTLLEKTIADLYVHISEQKVECFRIFLGCQRSILSFFGIGPMGPEVSRSVYTIILLFEALFARLYVYVFGRGLNIGYCAESKHTLSERHAP